MLSDLGPLPVLPPIKTVIGGSGIYCIYEHFNLHPCYGFSPPIVHFNWGRCPKGRGGFDELVKCDEQGILKDVRKAVEGV